MAYSNNATKRRHPVTSGQGPVGGALRRMRERRGETLPRLLHALSRRGRMRKRKAALVLSVGAIGLGTTANYMTLPSPSAAMAFEAAEKRRQAGKLRASETLKRALIEEEGVRLTVYRDIAGHATVGVGHKVLPRDGLRVGDAVSYDDVLDFLEADLGHAEEAVARLVGNLPLFQHEFDALVDLVYNVGEGNVSPHKSPRLNAALDAGDYEMVAAELDYEHAGGQIARGLIYRSERRANMFLQAAYDDPRQQGKQAISQA